jgi:ATP/maltotriose-dependent transcriptional regulator MalT/DNA-binding SARP family transcriptional activator
MREVLVSKITIPTLDDHVVPRAKLQAKLERIPLFPVTIMTAGAGYGKTTTLVQYLNSRKESIGWYNLGPEDDNLYSFSIYLAAALDRLFPGLKQWYCNKLESEETLDWKILFFSFMLGIEKFNASGAGGFLVVDDWQYVQRDADISMFFDRFLARAPRELQVILLSRQYVNLREVESLRMRGQALDFFPADFLFTSQEIEALIRLVHEAREYPVAAEALLEQTEGWVMVIKMLVNQWGNGTDPAALCDNEDILALDRFFEYLSHDIFERQSEPIKEFLMLTSLVENFDLAYCQAIVENGNSLNSAVLLNEVIKTGLFISRIGGKVYRYHSLFKELLRREARTYFTDIKNIYQKIGSFYGKQGNTELSLHFLILAEEWPSVAELLASVGRHWVNSGRQKAFCDYWEKLPPAYQENPRIYLALGDMERYASAYNKAVYWYKQAAKKFQAIHDRAGWSQSYHGLGEVYLDIIQPNQAQEYLRQAYKLLREDQEEEKGALLYLMSENMINQGNSRRAERYLQLRSQVVPYHTIDKNNLQARIFLRTGRIDEVISILEEKFKYEDMARTPCSFRETSLILTLCHTYKGDVEQALQYARSSIIFGNKIQSPFIETIGYVRMANALMLDYRHNREVCQETYAKALAMARKLGIERGKTEIYEGQCLVQALEGNWEKAEQLGLQVIAVTEKGHDEWFTAVMYHTLGMSAALCGKYRAGENYSQQALALFVKCRDYLGQAACYWQLAYQYYNLREADAFCRAYESLLELCRTYSYGFLLERKTFLGDITGFTTEPLALYYASLQQLGTKAVSTAESTVPAIYIKTLGSFTILRGGQEVASAEWHRKAAKQLLFLLITLRNLPVEKEKFMVDLWPDSEKKVAQGNFKVVLNQLSNILEPDRKPRAKSRFIVKEHASLQLRIGADCQLDVCIFEKCIHEGSSLLQGNRLRAQELLLQGLELYGGEYLAGEYLDDTSLRERDRLRLLAVKGMEMLAGLYTAQQDYLQGIHWADRLLRIDPCWERAYQLKLTCYGEQHDKSLLERVYRQCVATLGSELGVEPSQETKKLYLKYKAA